MDQGTQKSEQEWRKKLTPEQYRVLREKGTEAAFSGKHHDCTDVGMYRCVACGTELFSSEAKFDSGTGWPSFTDSANTENIELRPDDSQGRSRVEVICRKCGGHLGHVFDDGPQEAGGKRYCINSCVLDLKKK